MSLCILFAKRRSDRLCSAVAGQGWLDEFFFGRGILVGTGDGSITIARGWARRRLAEVVSARGPVEVGEGAIACHGA